MTYSTNLFNLLLKKKDNFQNDRNQFYLNALSVNKLRKDTRPERHCFCCLSSAE